MEAGPNAVPAFSREGYRKTDLNALDLFDALSYGGFRRFLRRYPSMCQYELRRSFQPRIILPLAAGSSKTFPHSFGQVGRPSPMSYWMKAIAGL